MVKSARLVIGRRFERLPARRPKYVSSALVRRVESLAYSTFRTRAARQRRVSCFNFAT